MSQETALSNTLNSIEVSNMMIMNTLMKSILTYSFHTDYNLINVIRLVKKINSTG